ncbi:trifunctional serine/threonine-protein kinase/ATP-binding protein/sensor histidine kinase [Haliangium sp.]|uniref:trifunctional serine/threonine-protein kinase/ATP-binding protein/sensor histidine kinase n=1 Tax=Haliangium sp. TaxID=2663208 RepID=UPI003D0FBFA5
MLDIGDVCADRYRLTRRLSTAWSGIERFLAEDMGQGAPVILQAVSAERVPHATRLRVADEAVIVSEVADGAFLPVLGSGLHGDVLYQVTPRLDGDLLSARIDAQPLSVADTVALATRATAALDLAHRNGLVHRSITPFDLHIASDDRLYPLGFGCVRAPDLETDDRAMLVQRARYASPEEAGMVHASVDGRADLYSLGVTVYQCVSGEVPFLGDNVGELLRNHLTATPAPLRERRGEVPRVLDELVQRLLHKDPEQRYQSAQALLVDLEEIGRRLARGEAEPELTLGLADRRLALTQPSFIGRAKELACIETQFEAARAGKGDLVLIEAPSGGGKSRLLEEVMLRATQRGLWLLRGQGVAEGGLPYEALEGLTREVVRAGQDEPTLAARLREALEEHLQASYEVFPGLRSLLGEVPERDFGVAVGAQERTQRALTEYVCALGTAERPAVVVIDDAQWADTSTLETVASWRTRVARGSGASSHTLVLLAFRSDEGDAVRALETDTHLVLPPLRQPEVRALLESMAGALPDDIATTVIRLADGSPFLAASLLRGLVEVGALQHQGATWVVESSALDDMRSSADGAVMLQRRLTHLAEETLAVLEIGAVLGRHFAAHIVAELSRRERRLVNQTLAEACRQQLLWANADLTTYTFVHDKLREAVLDRLSPDQQRALHVAAAAELETQVPASASEVAYHYDAGGEPVRALPFAIEAAEDARRRHALSVAESLYRVALRGEEAADQAMARRIQLGLADILLLQGRFDEAEGHLEAGRQLAESHEQRVEVESQFGKHFHQRCNFPKAVEHLERSLVMRGVSLPRRPTWVALRLLKEVGVQVLHRVFPRWLRARGPLDRAEHDLGVALDLVRLSYTWLFLGNPKASLWAVLRAVNQAERYLPGATLGEAYGFITFAGSMGLGYDAVAYYGEGALDYSRRFGNLFQEGLSHARVGSAMFWMARWDESLHHAEIAVRMFERAGEAFEGGSALYVASMAAFRLGDLRAGLAYARRLYDDGVARQLPQGFATGLAIWAFASGGQVPEQAFETDMPGVEDDLVRRQCLYLARGVCCYYRGDSRAAVELLEQASNAHDRFTASVATSMTVLPWYATVLRRAALETPPHAPAERRGFLRRARRAARQGLKTAGRLPAGHPHALRELGLLAAYDDEPGEARRLLDQSLAEARRQQARIEEAYTLWMRGRVGLSLGWEDADVDLAKGRTTLRELGAGFILAAEGDEGISGGAEGFSLSLADRFTTIQEQGRRIAAALSRDAVFDATHEAGKTLLRGDVAVVLMRASDAPDAPWRPVAGDVGRTDIEPELLRRAAESGQPLIAADDEELSGVDEVGIRSALGVPIKERGRCAAVLLVEHHGVAGLYGDEEARLGEYIATLAGAALENAAGFAEVQELSRSLEQRVVERTAELADSNVKLQDSLRQLHEAQQRLIRMSREAGMAEIATGVLHNVGNLLNSLQTSTFVAIERLQASSIDSVSRSSALLDQHQGDLVAFFVHDRRGQRFPELLQRLGERLIDERDQVLVEMQRIQELIGHIKKVVQAQQVYATRASVKEECALTALVEEALELQAERLARHQVTVVRELAELPSFALERHKLVQILINLISNAIDAMVEVPAGERRLSVRVRAHDGDSSPPIAHVDVADNGRGIARENLVRVFQYGFTTKADGHGFGLHSSVLAANEMGGALRCSSDGPGTGATFTLDLPMQPA